MHDCGTYERVPLFALYSIEQAHDRNERFGVLVSFYEVRFK